MSIFFDVNKLILAEKLDFYSLMHSHIPNTIYVLSCSVLLIICFSNRFFYKVNDDYVGSRDQISQYFMAVKGFINDNISPEITTGEGKSGRYFYPLGIYWLCGLLARTKLFKEKKLYSDCDCKLYVGLPNKKKSYFVNIWRY